MFLYLYGQVMFLNLIQAAGSLSTDLQAQPYTHKRIYTGVWKSHLNLQHTSRF
jgi:hypothetical protein